LPGGVLNDLHGLGVALDDPPGRGEGRDRARARRLGDALDEPLPSPAVGPVDRRVGRDYADQRCTSPRCSFPCRRLIVLTQITSQRLAHNLYGDPVTRDLVVYLPPGYDHGDARYPTVYLLHGFNGSALGWVAAFRQQYPFRNIYDVLDDAIRRHQS